MADRCTQLVLEALGRAAAVSAGVPLLGKNALFPATAGGKEAAQVCKERAYLHVLREESRGKASQEICRITDQGLDYLLNQQGPRQIVTDFLQVLQARHDQLDLLVTAAQQARAELVGMRSTAEQVLEKLPQVQPPLPGPERLQETIVAQLDAWQSAGALDDCPLAELYERVNQATSLTIGQFHDALRDLIQRKRVYLHPWTGPLYALPQPQLAMLIGHQIAYYASLRSSQVSVSA